MFLMHIVEQTGPTTAAEPLRNAHGILLCEKFASKMLDTIFACLGRVAQNSEAYRAVWAYNMIAARLLSAGPEATRHRCLDFLAQSRSVCIKWMRMHSGKSKGALSNDESSECLQRSLEAALVCLSTFDVAQCHLDQILTDAAQTTIFVESSIRTKETISEAHSKDITMNTLMFRWTRLSQRAFQALARDRNTKEGLNTAVREAWAYFCPSEDGWALHGSWVIARTSAILEDEPTIVHFDLLRAELRINGQPLSHLPEEFAAHPQFKCLFGTRQLEVYPLGSQGMQYLSKGTFNDHEVSLDLEPTPDAEGDLLVRARRQDVTYTLVPRRLLTEKLPRSFSDQFVHWYNERECSIELRPNDDPWGIKKGSWRLQKQGDLWFLTGQDGSRLVDPTSATATSVAEVFQPIETASGLHIFYSAAANEICVRIPRFNLDFSVDCGTAILSSHQFRGMQVDVDQSLETLLGLQNRLLLCRAEESDARMVLIPEGEVKLSQSRDHDDRYHHAVEVDLSTACRIQSFRVDRVLGRLVGNGTLRSKIYLAHLHALTSFCIPDPLTGLTGTEQALRILQSAEVRSFDWLSVENVERLGRIAEMTPKRRRYPLEESAMQIVAWRGDSLGELSQHPGLYKAVKSLFVQAAETQFFYPSNTAKIPKLAMWDVRLLNRDEIRSSTFYGSGFGAEYHSTAFDEEYTSAARAPAPDKAHMVYRACRILASGAEVALAKPVSTFTSDIKRIFGTGGVRGRVSAIPESELQYDLRWLQDPRELMGDLFCRIHATLIRQEVSLNKFHLMLWISTMIFAENSSDSMVQLLLSFASLSATRQLQAPDASRFLLHKSPKPLKADLKNIGKEAYVDFTASPEAQRPDRPGETRKAANTRRRNTFKEKQKEVLENFAVFMADQWYDNRLAPPTFPLDASFAQYIGHEGAVAATHRLFKTCIANGCFLKFVADLKEIIRRAELLDCAEVPSPRLLPPSTPDLQETERCVSILSALKQAVVIRFSRTELPCLSQRLLKEVQHPVSPSLSGLRALVMQRIASTQLTCYVTELQRSISSLGDHTESHSLVLPALGIEKVLLHHFKDCKQRFDSAMDAVVKAIGKNQRLRNDQHSSVNIVATTHHWPRVTLAIILEQINRHNRSSLPGDWMQRIVDLGQKLTCLQQAGRLLQMSSRETALIEELRNHVRRNWSPEKHPDTLLLEIEGGFRVRHAQEDIARLMRTPPKGENAVLQLNMGEGKSSVIIPMIVTRIAKGRTLTRVIVAKPQSRQMLEMLMSSLGGLVSRRVYHMPFSRGLAVGEEEILTIQRIFSECRKSGGVLLVQPEHVLSLQLLAIEMLLSPRLKLRASSRSRRQTDGQAVAEPEKTGADIQQLLLDILNFCNAYSRDIVDESDENFSPKFELIYTMGKQEILEFAPDRWLIIQEVLSLVAKLAPRFQQTAPASVEIDGRHDDRVPRVRFLLQDAADKMCLLLAETICHNGLASFFFGRQPTEMKNAIVQFITEKIVSKEAAGLVEGSELWGQSTRSALLVLRGLFAGGILSFALSQKRWSVNFGLDRDRVPSTALAVPYRAKGVPARSEFSHPDLQIVLTCLSYYYGGLSDKDILLSFEHLTKSDQAEHEYATWIAPTSLPTAFRSLDGVNIRDREQCSRTLFPQLRYSKGAIDYFLSRIVFPREMKEFPQKLSASGWDIGRSKAHPTTAFSGTNDSRHLLPLEMNQLEVPSQVHTNALVLNHLLSADNKVVLLSELGHTGPCVSSQLLNTIAEMKPEPRVILDIGAQILELTNEQVATAWLELLSDRDDIRAAIFCNDLDELIVVDRLGRREPLQTSSFAKQMDVCLVFLDEAHCRGINLALPEWYQAAVILGAKLTKDRLAQACMRMRKLGAGQTLVFCVPHEVETRIRLQNPNQQNSKIDIMAILAWTMSETLEDTKQSIPIWAAQGRRFEQQRILWSEAKTEGGLKVDQDLAEKFLESEAKSLESRYQPFYVPPPSISELPITNGSLERIVERCRDFGAQDDQSAGLEEQQERELMPELEEECEVERRTTFEPAGHRLHQNVRKYIETGSIPSNETGFMWAFQSLAETTATQHFNVRNFPRGLRVTQDFACTLQGDAPREKGTDAFQREVRFILTSFNSQKQDSIMVIISPYEAEKLMPEIRASRHVTLHLYAPRQNENHEPIDLNGTGLYQISSGPTPRGPISRRLLIELNLFAGQLYFKSFQEYIDVCDFLNLTWGDPADADGAAIDGFIEPRKRVRPHSGRTNFPSSPVQFLRILMSKIRRDGSSIDRTHVGKMLNGVLLTEDDFAPRPKRKADAMEEGVDEGTMFVEGEDDGTSQADA